MATPRIPASDRIPTYRLYRERSEESADFWLHCETLPERTRLHNWTIGLHRHASFFQLFLLTAGSGALDEGSVRRGLAAPAMVFVPPGAVHGFRFARDVDGLVLTALADRLQPVAADRVLGRLLSGVRVVPVAADAPPAAAVRRLHGELSRRAPGQALVLEALVIEALVGFARAALAMANRDGADGETGDPRLARLEALIGAHCRSARAVGFYAARLGVSPGHLNRLTRAATGLSVHGLIAERLMQAARRDLIFTETPVQAIALALGFQDPAYFHRFFRRRAGLPPGAFRAAERRKLAG
ncbi:helix-turn-helix domain-containing protein [Aquibium sp. A9E412]|uniref:helix-turn-helix domain-containing protein n=1 Tax=Aquibium sp. A9E412 TaxID=2976767 RepID=UPI0025AFBB68|nr:helix-turn-helix domain-containing protein [Aquibium sp. A9E412]MDN2566567.1 helix-turn-helix domain-containing protein [Aquibium sp. A9E412]